MTRSLLLAPLWLVLACSDHTFEELDVVHEMGDLTIMGRVCDPERHEWLVGAQVYTHLVDETDTVFASIDTVTDAEGRFALTELLPDRSYSVFVQHGSRTVDMFTVEVHGSDVELEEPTCGVNAGARVAVVTGDYDDFSMVLDAAGVVDYELINGQTGEELAQFLSDGAHLAEYDALFFPGGSLEEDIFYDTDGNAPAGQVEAIRSALSAYVETGGNLVASDWSYDAVERLWPDRVEFLGDDAVADAAQLGEVAAISANVADSALASALGGASVALEFDYDAWPVMQAVDPSVTVYLTGNAPYRQGMTPSTLADAPLMIGFTQGTGQVWLTSFRYEAQLGGAADGVIRFVLDRV